jgi:3-carboxy-cis,cis-muconate cycloisomerase
MKPSSSPSKPGPGPGTGGGLFGPLFGDARSDRELDARAWLAAMLDVERALARAEASAGVVPGEAADAIAAACHVDLYDIDSIAQRSTAAGNPVVPLVRDLGARVPAHAAPFVHLGATSQDVLDTAAALVARRALTPVLDDLAAAADAAAVLADRHRDTVLAGRTLMQHALPTTFGLKAAGWLVALDEARAALAQVRDDRLAVQFGGAAGTLAALDTAGITVLRLLAEELGLAEPTVPWHTNRVRVAQLAGALGTTAGVLGKIALDVVLLAQSEVAEVAEPADGGRGGSSAMPHKRNPIGAILVSAGTRRVPELVATLLGAMPQEHERAAGAWHAEWEPLTEALRLVGGAAAGTRELLAGLRVDTARMAQNLAAGGDLLMAESVAGRLATASGRGDAHELVARLSREATAAGRSLREALLADPGVRERLSTEDIDAALDPQNYLGAAGELVNRALAAHHKTGGGR